MVNSVNVKTLPPGNHCSCSWIIVSLLSVEFHQSRCELGGGGGPLFTEWSHCHTLYTLLRRNVTPGSGLVVTLLLSRSSSRSEAEARSSKCIYCQDKPESQVFPLFEFEKWYFSFITASWC